MKGEKRTLLIRTKHNMQHPILTHLKNWVSARTVFIVFFLKMKLLSASLLVLWSCLVYNVQQSCANHWPPSPDKALSPVSENGPFPTPDSMLTVRLVVVFPG